MFPDCKAARAALVATCGKWTSPASGVRGGGHSAKQSYHVKLNEEKNVVAACKRCNWLKDCRIPEEANMPLLAIPFKPNSYEWHFLAKDRVLADQMEYLSTQFRADRDWAH